MRANRFGLVLCGCIAGCSAEGEIGLAREALTAEVAGSGDIAGKAPQLLADPDGLQWVTVGPVRTFSTSGSTTRSAALRLEGQGRTLSVSELARKLQPHMLGADNIEYVLDSSQALAFARHVQAETRRDEDIFDNGDPPRLVSELPTKQIAPNVPSATNGVFDGESRQNINAIAVNPPFVMIGILKERCTLFKMINAHTAVTSAHCVYDDNGWKTKVPIQFGAGSPTPLVELDQGCYSVMVPGGWTEDVGDDEYDYAVIRLRTTGGTGAAHCDPAGYDIGHFGYRGVSGCTTDVRGDMAGYPGKGGPGAPPPGAWTYPTLFNDFREDGWTSCITYPNHLWYLNDNSGGQSGGPFFTSNGTDFQVRAINMSISPGVFDDSNAGRRLDSSVIDFLTEFAGF